MDYHVLIEDVMSRRYIPLAFIHPVDTMKVVWTVPYVPMYGRTGSMSTSPSCIAPCDTPPRAAHIEASNEPRHHSCAALQCLGLMSQSLGQVANQLALDIA